MWASFRLYSSFRFLPALTFWVLSLTPQVETAQRNTWKIYLGLWNWTAHSFLSFKSICSTLCQTLCKMKNNASCYSFSLSWRDKMELILLLGKRGFPDGSVGKESTCSAGNPSLIPGSRRSPGEGNGNPLQYSCLKNPRDRGAWRGTVHGVTKSRMRLSNK